MIKPMILQSITKDYLALGDAFNSLKIKLDSAFAYSNREERFQGVDLATMEEFKVFSDKVMKRYRDFIVREVSKEEE